MTRLIITDPADADSVEIIRDLTVKAGVLVAEKVDTLARETAGLAAELQKAKDRIDKLEQRAATILTGTQILQVSNRTGRFRINFPQQLKTVPKGSVSVSGITSYNLGRPDGTHLAAVVGIDSVDTAGISGTVRVDYGTDIDKITVSWIAFE